MQFGQARRHLRSLARYALVGEHAPLHQRGEAAGQGSGSKCACRRMASPISPGMSRGSSNHSRIAGHLRVDHQAQMADGVHDQHASSPSGVRCT